MSKHTPGPWIATTKHRLHRLEVRQSAVAKGYDSATWPNGVHTICEWREHRSGAKRGESVHWQGYTDEELSNACLIAAAPELLEVCRELLAQFPAAGYTVEQAAVLQRAEDTIVRATQ